ncbi:MAG: type II toxin-antitoxin system HicB family antitoxin [Actinomycetota bacterium]|jgi:predicted RNase H-like HicB family nuclease|nr:type II toxin-antitoxin system HicB family antitoxin [Actinomycetota bacterium]
MSRYTARAEWDPTGWWVVTIPEVPGAITQARRLDQVPKDAGEVLKLMGKGRPNQYELRVEAHYPGEHGALAERAAGLHRQAENLDQVARDAVRAAVAALRSDGLTLRDTASLVGISYQRAQQIERSDRETTTPAG